MNLPEQGILAIQVKHEQLDGDRQQFPELVPASFLYAGTHGMGETKH